MTLEERIEKLEEQVVRLSEKVTATDKQETIDARGFCVVDECGKSRALLGEEGLLFFDDNGDTCVLLDGKALRLLDKHTGCHLILDLDLGLTMTLRNSGGSFILSPNGLITSDEHGMRCITLSQMGLELKDHEVGQVTVAPYGIYLKDEDGHPLFSLERSHLELSSNWPGLQLVDQHGRARISLEVKQEGPCMVMSDENGKERVRVSVAKDVVWAEVKDENGKTRANLGAATTGTAFTVFDENGKRVFPRGLW